MTDLETLSEVIRLLVRPFSLNHIEHGPTEFSDRAVQRLTESGCVATVRGGYVDLTAEQYEAVVAIIEP